MGGEEACALLEREAHLKRPIAVAYVDIRMPPGIDGVATVRNIRRFDRAIEIVLMTAYTDTPLADIVQDMELLHKLLYIRKPFAREEIQQITLALVEKWNLEQELAARRRQLTVTNRRLTAVLDSIGEAIAVADDAQRLVFANSYYQRLMDCCEADFSGRGTRVAGVRLARQRTRTERSHRTCRTDGDQRHHSGSRSALAPAVGTPGTWRRGGVRRAGAGAAVGRGGTPGGA